MNKTKLQVNQQQGKEEKMDTFEPQIGHVGGATQTQKKVRVIMDLYIFLYIFKNY